MTGIASPGKVTRMSNTTATARNRPIDRAAEAIKNPVPNWEADHYPPDDDGYGRAYVALNAALDRDEIENVMNEHGSW